MTDYCAATDVSGRLKGVTFSTSTAPTLAQVGALITLHSAEIDGRLHAKYTVPVTGTTSLAIVKEICTLMTLADVLDVTHGGLSRMAEGEQRVDYRKMAVKMLDDIAEGKLALHDAAAKSTYDFVNDNVDNDREFTMQKDEVQW